MAARRVVGVGSGRLLSKRSHRLQTGPSTVGLGGPGERLYYGMGMPIMGGWVAFNPWLAGYGVMSVYLPGRKITIAAVTTPGCRAEVATTARRSSGGSRPAWRPGTRSQSGHSSTTARGGLQLDFAELCQDWPIKYLALIYGNREIWDVPEERMREIITAVDAFNRRLAESGELVAVDGLVPRVWAVRAPDGVPVVSDGPYLEAKEHVGSYFIVDVASEQRALEIAQAYPALGPDGGGIELWPLMSGSRDA